MLRNEVCIGNYLSGEKATAQARVSSCTEARRTMVLLIQKLHGIKGYRELTLYLAVNIADMYLSKLI